MSTKKQQPSFDTVWTMLRRRLGDPPLDPLAPLVREYARACYDERCGLEPLTAEEVAARVLDEQIRAFRRYEAHDFDHDAAFQAGWSGIRASLESRGLSELQREQEAEKARLFYFARRVEPIDADLYRVWKKKKGEEDEQMKGRYAAQVEQLRQSAEFRSALDLAFDGDSDPSIAMSSAGGIQEQTLKSDGGDATAGAEQRTLSFAEIMQMVERGEPIPGIKVFPEQINDQQPSAPRLRPREKPWEKVPSSTS